MGSNIYFNHFDNSNSFYKILENHTISIVKFDILP